MAQSIRVDSSLKKEPPNHKRNLTVGFNSNQNQSVAFQTINGAGQLNDSSLLLEDSSIIGNTRNRPKLRLTDIMNSQMLTTAQPSAEDKAFFGIQSSNSLMDAGQSFTSNLSKRLANAMTKHTSAQYKWLK